MTKIFGRRPAMTDELHRATSFEVFFDLVFVFAITRVISFMAHSLSLVTLTRGLLLLLLLWWSWTAYAWLGNRPAPIRASSASACWWRWPRSSSPPWSCPTRGEATGR